ncbi:MAG: ATP-binding cassette domain-containing protein [Proteobacteria bacterium]|nr:ATP-binding cassette domain-containing protein [Pseudomonadota bacterium]
MLSARDLTLRRGPEPLFEQVNFIIFRGDRVGLTGANGAGKSSLFAAIRGELAPDRGEIEVPANLSMAVVEQEITAVDRPAIEFVLDGDTELRRVMGRIAQAEADESRAMELAELYAELLAIDGYRARARAAAIMHGLGFDTVDHERTVGEFSGGWRVRLAMARALNSRADLLLLDEPTNHLDLDAIVWLEDWLRDFPGTLLMISHDRDFLDAVIGRVLHIENHAIRAYSGNYSQFEVKRAEELAQQKSLLARQQRQIAHITSYINRFRASATKARQAQSRIKMLERMERIVPAHVDSPFEFEFRKPAKTPRPLLTLDEAACGYGERVIVGGIDLSIGPQDRIALLGLNGAGKSTFTKFLAGESAPLSGQRIASPDLAVGYFAQQQLEQLNPAESAFWHVRNLGGPDYARCEEQAVRDHLGRFGFSGDRVFEPIGVFSGGEKARLTLALIVARRPNLLLLDEPTNHLDIEMRHALTVALQSFEGGMVVVSHDRHLIKMVADSLYLVADGRVQPFEGDLEDYQRWLKDRGKQSKPPQPASAPPRPRLAAASGAVPPNPQRQKAMMQRELTKLEERLARLQAELKRLDTLLAGPGMHDRTGAAEAKQLGVKRAEIAAQIERTEAKWLEVGTELDPFRP